MVVPPSSHLYILREAHVKTLRLPFGPVVRTASQVKELIPQEGRIFAVGDRTSFELLKGGVQIQSFFYDGLEKRARTQDDVLEFLENAEGFEKKVVVKNPSGGITCELWRTVLESTKKHIKIRVRGEEDLAALALFRVLKNGDTVVYGIPGKGMCVAVMTDEIRKTAMTLITGDDDENTLCNTSHG